MGVKCVGGNMCTRNPGHARLVLSLGEFCSLCLPNVQVVPLQVTDTSRCLLFWVFSFELFFIMIIDSIKRHRLHEYIMLICVSFEWDLSLNSRGSLCHYADVLINFMSHRCFLVSIFRCVCLSIWSVITISSEFTHSICSGVSYDLKHSKTEKNKEELTFSTTGPSSGITLRWGLHTWEIWEVTFRVVSALTSVNDSESTGALDCMMWN